MRVAKTLRQRGFVLITMAIVTIALVGALGMAVDVGRAFIAKNEVQTFCDAASMAAVLMMDGTVTGISNAKTAVANTTNGWNMDTASVSNPTLDFGTSASGPWSTNPSPATGFTFARVQATVPLPFYFAPMVTGSLTQNVYSVSIAAQIPITSFTRGLAPYTVVSTTPLLPNFGLVLGQQYDIQWPNRSATKFIQAPCTGDPQVSQDAVWANWSSSVSGYWGANSSSVIYQEVVDNTQIAPISIGENIMSILTGGNKMTQATALDTRVQEDSDYTDTTPADAFSLSDYINNPVHNGRRLIALPIVDPTSTSNTSVLGYAAFLLISDGTATSSFYKSHSSGNDPYCAIYAGSYIQGGVNPGTGTGAFRVGPVQ
jgi:Flp pilus assembly protein TadG